MKFFSRDEVKKAILENVEAVLDQVDEKYQSVEEQVSEAYGDAREVVADSRRKAADHIRRNPERSVAIAAGVGALTALVVSFLISGRRR
jgi:ElaB/YqjD/DUF883 family membrane-anchored ribosome-binding protein